MENASKALIIAGAILVAILLIGIGVGLINALNNPMSEAEGTLSGQSISMFNSKFEKYQGKQNGSNISTLISEIITSNATNQNNQKVGLQTVNWVNASGNTSSANYPASSVNTTQLTTQKNNVLKNHTYSVTFSIANSGYIDKIIINY